MPRVSVVVPARAAARTLPAALASIAAQTYPHIAEVIVATADEETARVAAEAEARVVDNPDGTTPAGLNRAIEAASGEVIVRCDAHAVLPPHYVERAVETLQRTGAANVGGMQVPVGKTFWEEAIAVAMSSRLGAGDARYRIGGEEGPVETVYLGVYDKGTLDRLGGFDESFVRNQDYELNHRIIESGGVVWFDPELKVEYRPRGSLAELGRQYFLYGRGKRHMARQHPGSLRWRQLAAPAIVVVLAAALLLSIPWPWALLVPLLYLMALEIYAAVVLGEAAKSVGVAAALATMHLSWGAGFLTG
ncbi:MAG: glycosyltransferase family 2 protein [Actinobacteria bacterium]|nr:glycosyltransferase family 2 protein [Actinomycetota bacterium]